MTRPTLKTRPSSTTNSSIAKQVTRGIIPSSATPGPAEAEGAGAGDSGSSPRATSATSRARRSARDIVDPERTVFRDWSVLLEGNARCDHTYIRTVPAATAQERADP